MELPFTTAQFFEVFQRYNAAIWPAQLGASTLGVIALTGLGIGSRFGDRLILIILAVFWAWNGAGYHLGFFAEINPAAYGFGAAFLLQAALFLREAIRPEPARFRFAAALPGVLAGLLALFAMTLYGAIGRTLGHGGMGGPLFGVAPCPTTLFTLALLALSTETRPLGRVLTLSAIPALWALIGSTAALMLGVYEDLSLLAALAVLGLALWSARADATNPRETEFPRK